MGYLYIQYALQRRVAYITLNRPEKRNALHEGMVGELNRAFRLAEEDEGVRVIVLRANGSVFSAGADLGHLEKLRRNTYDENLADSRGLMELLLRIYRHPKPVIAQVEGHAIAGGCGLATICDLCYAVPEADFGYTEARIGFIPALVSVFLVRKIGEGRARELLLTSRLIGAAEAAGMGLITAVLDPGVIEMLVQEKAEGLGARVSGQSVAATKDLLSSLHGLSLTDALELAAARNAGARATEDCQKGIQAFLEKRTIEW